MIGPNWLSVREEQCKFHIRIARRDIEDAGGLVRYQRAIGADTSARDVSQIVWPMVIVIRPGAE